MNTNLFFLSVIQLTMSIFVGVIVLYLTYYFTLKVFEKKKYEIKNDNIAFSIFLSAIIFSVGLIVSTAFEPAMNVIQLIQNTVQSKTELFFEFTKYLFLFIGIGIIVSIIVIIVSVKLYDFLTKKINELKEISENNVAIALVTGFIIIVISLFAKDSVSMMIESLIPYPDLPAIY
jgi:uncharacterized membrane protein YjfL (UPF0719 family)